MILPVLVPLSSPVADFSLSLETADLQGLGRVLSFHSKGLMSGHVVERQTGAPILMMELLDNGGTCLCVAFFLSFLTGSG